MSLQKRVIFYVLMILFTVSLTEFLGHIVYKLYTGEFIWQTEVKARETFSVRDFIYPVDDERYFTNKPNYLYSARNHIDPKQKWSLQLDDHGFRTGTWYAPGGNNVVFLGDSVPFGWGVNDDKTVPARFFELIAGSNSLDYGVINAAIPSYSLYQAIKRYEYEIHDRFGIKYIILQTYDPVNQFEDFGRQWNKNLNWYTKKFANNGDIPWLRYSALYWMFKQSVYLVSEQSRKLDIQDTAAFDYFRSENISSLDELLKLAERDGAKLILLPIAVPHHAIQPQNTMRPVVITAFNETLKEYADVHHDVYFFDLEAYLYQFSDDDIFLDDCCHLSEIGARMQAEFILKDLASIDGSFQQRVGEPVDRSQQLADYLAEETTSGDVVISLTSTDYFSKHINSLRQDLIYIDRKDFKDLPPILNNRWYIFYAEKIPAQLAQEGGVKDFGYIMLVHRQGQCTLENCLSEAQSIFSQVAQANPELPTTRMIVEEVLPYIAGLTHTNMGNRIK